MIITIANQKGGSGKSTTSAEIIALANLNGLRTLAIDLDAQGNLSYILQSAKTAGGSFNVLTGKEDALEAIEEIKTGDILTAGLELTGADSILTGKDRTTALERAIKPIEPLYDLIVIDTPPTLNTLLINALNASDKVLIPMRANVLHLQGLYQLERTIEHVQQTSNKRLEVMGVFLTMYSDRTILSRDMKEEIQTACKSMGLPFLHTEIRESIAVQEAQTVQEPLYQYAKRSKPAEDYQALFHELKLDRIRKSKHETR